MVNLKEQLLMLNLKQFYSEPNNIKILLPILEGKTNISLRSLDWFVTNYSKNNNVILNNNNRYYNVWLDYKSQLKAFSKKSFDPFCRRNRIVFEVLKDKYLTTTVGQLNFFKWAIENNILAYVNENIKLIEKDMNANKNYININTNKKLNKNQIDIVISFD